MKAVEDLLHRQGAYPSGRQLDRQRHAVQTPADLADDRRLVVLEVEI